MATGDVPAVNGPTRYVTARCLSLFVPQRISQFSTDAIPGTRTSVRVVQFITIRCVTVTVCAADWYSVRPSVCKSPHFKPVSTKSI